METKVPCGWEGITVSPRLGMGQRLDRNPHRSPKDPVERTTNHASPPRWGVRSHQRGGYWGLLRPANRALILLLQGGQARPYPPVQRVEAEDPAGRDGFPLGWVGGRAGEGASVCSSRWLRPLVSHKGGNGAGLVRSEKMHTSIAQIHHSSCLGDRFQAWPKKQISPFLFFLYCKATVWLVVACLLFPSQQIHFSYLSPQQGETLQVPLQCQSIKPLPFKNEHQTKKINKYCFCFVKWHSTTVAIFPLRCTSFSLQQWAECGLHTLRETDKGWLQFKAQCSGHEKRGWGGGGEVARAEVLLQWVTMHHCVVAPPPLPPATHPIPSYPTPQNQAQTPTSWVWLTPLYPPILRSLSLALFPFRSLCLSSPHLFVCPAGWPTKAPPAWDSEADPFPRHFVPLLFPLPWEGFSSKMKMQRVRTEREGRGDLTDTYTDHNRNWIQVSRDRAS